MTNMNEKERGSKTMGCGFRVEKRNSEIATDLNENLRLLSPEEM
jgi:hypothetical protein